MLRILLMLVLVSHGAVAATTKLDIQVKPGDTLSGILETVGVGASDAAAITQELSNIYNPSNLKVGQEISIFVRHDTGDHEKLVFDSLVVELPSRREVRVSAIAPGLYIAKAMDRLLTSRTVKIQGRISRSLFADAQSAGMPISIITQLIKLFSYDVDFQRDIHPNNQFEVLFEEYLDEFGKSDSVGQVVYAKLILKDKTLKIYRHRLPDGDVAYYDEQGQTIKKSLLRTPVDGARISSGYGKRRHPILGYTRMHKGIDFAAPSGTPIYAAGDGKISYIGKKGSYGYYIRIDHSNGYSTAYAHLRRFARKLKRGSSVKQGQIIGYVGTTGRSTGPHLHYETLRWGNHINPLSIDTIPGRRLRGVKLAMFDEYRLAVEKIIGSAPTYAKVYSTKP